MNSKLFQIIRSGFKLRSFGFQPAFDAYDVKPRKFSKASTILFVGVPKNTISSGTTRYVSISSGTPGSGAGKGGGAGGSIKESGGGLGKYGAAQEEGYFYHKDKEKLMQIKKKLKAEPDKSKESYQKPSTS